MIKYIIWGCLAIFIIITLIRAAFWRPSKKVYQKLPREEVDLDRAVANLGRAIRFPTVSYPDQVQVDFMQFERLHAFLAEAYPLLHARLRLEKVSRAGLLYYWAGKDPALKPIALLAHQDVVPVPEETLGDWLHPAFSGHNDGEYIWGRGALDMKNQLICVLEAVETLLQEGYEPCRGVYLCFGYNEEIADTGVSSAKRIVELLQSRNVLLESLLDEGGPFQLMKFKGFFDKRIAAVGISEKGYADFEITVRAKGGHSAKPPKHSALGELAIAIQELEKHQFRGKILPFLTELLITIGRNATYPVRLFFCNFWLLKPLIKPAMSRVQAVAGFVRTTTAVTMARGSSACNVMPQKATANVNFRMMPGVSINDVENHIRKVTSNKKLEIRLIKGREAAPFSSTDSKAYKMIETLAIGQELDGITVPFLIGGGTDASYYTPICDHIYRFSPFYLTQELLDSVHGTNERIPISSIFAAVAFFKRYIRGLTC
jgi:carboxypeptidase PM20D1